MGNAVRGADAPRPSAHEARIRADMEALLARARLEYRGGFVGVGAHSVHYLDYGPSDQAAGPPVLLLHGASGGGAVWYRQIAALRRGRRVIAPDHPIFGLSSRPVLRGATVEFARDYLTGFLDAIDVERADVAGLPLGGFAAAILAIAQPHRVRRLALIGSLGLGKELPWVFRLMTVPVIGTLLARPPRALRDRFFDTYEVAHPELADGPLMKRYFHDAGRAEGYAAAMCSGVRGVASLAGQRCALSDDELASIQAPTLIVWGARDRFFPVAHAERAHRLIAGSGLVVLPGAGHVVTFDEADRVSALLADFFGG